MVASLISEKSNLGQNEGITLVSYRDYLNTIRKHTYIGAKSPHPQNEIDLRGK